MKEIKNRLDQGLRPLQLVFLVLGYLGIAAVILHFVHHYLAISVPEKLWIIGKSSREHLTLAAFFLKIFRGLGDTFFFFMVAAVFGILQKREIDFSSVKRLVNVTCASYLSQSLLLVYAVFSVYFPTFQIENFGIVFGPMFTLMEILGASVPLVYAITIYVLFRHFSRMVEFEAEVA